VQQGLEVAVQLALLESLALQALLEAVQQVLLAVQVLLAQLEQQA
jgi:hypothetical protein